MKTIAALVSASAIFSIVSLAQESSDNSPEKNAIMANDRAYEVAYAKGDVKAMDCAVSYMKAGKRRAMATINRDRENLKTEVELETELLLKPPVDITIQPAEV